MPKIIPGLRDRLVEEAERQLVTGGYTALTIRSVAKACHVAVGTVYNYFSSKEEFVASALLMQWQQVLQSLNAAAESAQNVDVLLRCIYDQLCTFIDQYKVLFHDEAAIAVFSASEGCYHDLLRRQLAQPLRPFCTSDFEAEFVAEAVLTWTVEGDGFEAIYQVVRKIFK